MIVDQGRRRFVSASTVPAGCTVRTSRHQRLTGEEQLSHNQKQQVTNHLAGRIERSIGQMIATGERRQMRAHVHLQMLEEFVVLHKCLRLQVQLFTIYSHLCL